MARPPADTLAAICHALTLAAAQRARELSGEGGFERRPGWLLTDSGTGLPGLDLAFVIDARAALANLDEPRHWFGASRGYTVVAREAFDDGVISALVEADFSSERRQPVLARSLPLGSHPLPAGFEVHHVESAAGIARYLSVRDDHPPGRPADDVEAAFIAAVTRSGEFRYFFATRAGVPIATAMAFEHDGAISISNVFVREAQRRKGLGAALTAHAVGSSAEASIAVLEASTMGRPLYERMGFATVYHAVRLASA